MSVQHSIRAKRTIFQATRKCADNFASCTTLLAGSSREALSQLRSRFELWVQYSGALASDAYSLDRRLLQDTDVAFSISSLLEGLAAILLQETETTSTSDTLNSLDEIRDRWREDSGDAWYFVDATIDTLLDFTHDIRKASRPKPVTISSEPADRVGGHDYNTEIFTILVRQLFPRSNVACQDHLARRIIEQQHAILQSQSRMRALSESHATKLETKGLMLPPAVVPPSVFSRTIFHSGDRAETATPSIISSIDSLAPEGSLVAGPQYPKLPIQASGAKEFLCDFCGRRLRFADLDEITWIAHIKKDLLPYLCLFPRCHGPRQRFVHREEWTRHMRKWHGDDWTLHALTSCWICDADDCKRKIFQDFESLKAHMQGSHGFLDFDHHDSKCWTETSRDPMQCPVCESIPQEIPDGLDLAAGRVLLWKHIGEHLKRLALYSLPSLGREDEQAMNVDYSSDDYTFSQASSHSKQTLHYSGRREPTISNPTIAGGQHDRKFSEIGHLSSDDRFLTRDIIKGPNTLTDPNSAPSQHQTVAPEAVSALNIEHVSIMDRQRLEQQHKWEPNTQELNKNELEEKRKWDTEMQDLRKKAAEAEIARKQAEEEVGRLRPLRPVDDLRKAPIRFKDAVGRKFSFPWHISKSWKGMETLINQAFLHIDGIGQHVRDGHYDLIGPDGDIILPQVWEFLVKPDWAISMHMRPLPGPKEVSSPAAGADSPPSPNEIAVQVSAMDKILTGSDLTISAEQIRAQVQQVIARDLTPQRDAMQDPIEQRFEDFLPPPALPPLPATEDAEGPKENLTRTATQVPGSPVQVHSPRMNPTKSKRRDVAGERRAGTADAPAKPFECPHDGCGKSYTRSEHLYRHQLNHSPKLICHCDFPGCERSFVRQDLCARHKERHTAKGSMLGRKENSIQDLNPIVAAAMQAQGARLKQGPQTSNTLPSPQHHVQYHSPAISASRGSSPTMIGEEAEEDTLVGRDPMLPSPVYDMSRNPSSHKSPWQDQLRSLCRARGYDEPAYQVASDRRGGRTAWSCTVKVQDSIHSTKYWYDSQYTHIAMEDAARVALDALGAVEEGSGIGRRRSEADLPVDLQSLELPASGTVGTTKSLETGP